MTLKVKAVIFDMDGVITNTMPDHFRAWRDIMKKEGIHVTHLDIYSREGQRGINSVQEIFQIYNKPYSYEKAVAMLTQKEQLFKKIVKRRFISGSRSFIRTLKKAGFTLALVTGTSRHELEEILPAAIREMFSVIVTGNDVKKGKPDPEPYLLALKKLKILASQAIVIENAPFGIRSGKAAGIKCLAIATSLPKTFLKEADYIFSDMAALRKTVQFIPAHEN